MTILYLFTPYYIMNSLANVVLSNCLSYLDYYPDVVAAERVNKKWNQVAKTEILAKDLCKTHWGPQISLEGNETWRQVLQAYRRMETGRGQQHQYASKNETTLSTSVRLENGQFYFVEGFSNNEIRITNKQTEEVTIIQERFTPSYGANSFASSVILSPSFLVVHGYSVGYKVINWHSKEVLLTFPIIRHFPLIAHIYDDRWFIVLNVVGGVYTLYLFDLKTRTQLWSQPLPLNNNFEMRCLPHCLFQDHLVIRFNSSIHLIDFATGALLPSPLINEPLHIWQENGKLYGICSKEDGILLRIWDHLREAPQEVVIPIPNIKSYELGLHLFERPLFILACKIERDLLFLVTKRPWENSRLLVFNIKNKQFLYGKFIKDSYEQLKILEYLEQIQIHLDHKSLIIDKRFFTMYFRSITTSIVYDFMNRETSLFSERVTVKSELEKTIDGGYFATVCGMLNHLVYTLVDTIINVSIKIFYLLKSLPLTIKTYTRKVWHYIH